MKQQLPGFEDMLFYVIGFQKGLNAEELPSLLES
jgi:hypothetical protein